MLSSPKDLTYTGKSLQKYVSPLVFKHFHHKILHNILMPPELLITEIYNNVFVYVLCLFIYHKYILLLYD